MKSKISFNTLTKKKYENNIYYRNLTDVPKYTIIKLCHKSNYHLLK
jgi:hypothetical protein